MTVPTRRWLAPALGLVFLHPCPGRAEESPAGPSPTPGSPAATLAAIRRAANQRTADAIAVQLRQSGRLHQYTVDVGFCDGAAEVIGTVADPGQREEVLRQVRAVPGVERVVDRLSVASPIQRVQAGEVSGSLQPLPKGPAAPPPPPAPPAVQPPAPPVQPPIPPVPPAGGAAAAPAVGGPPEAVPIFQAPGPVPYALNPPRMPPYAWPTYAPYNNYSRVAYPLAYPYNAWPYIGPCYPFPKIPLGWRSVKLEWDDGYWWYSKTATKYDWWKLRYW